MVRYGTIGTGWITDAFIKGAQMVEGMELLAVCSREQEKGDQFAREHDAPFVFTDYREMAECGDIDAVYIASPNVLHYEQSKLFLEHGKHVICEKPITVEPEELLELQVLAEEKGLIYMEAIMMLHLPQRKLLHDAVRRIGKVTTARFDFSQLSSKYPAFLAGNLPNIFNPRLATGCLMDLGIYCVYPAVDLFGEPQEIVTKAGFLSTGADGFDNSLFVYPDKQVNISCSKIGQSAIGSEILGDQGTLLIRSISQLTGITYIGRDGKEEKLVGSIEKSKLMSGEVQSFYHYITFPETYKVEYQEKSRLTLQVNRLLKQMRQQAGIVFS